MQLRNRLRIISVMCVFVSSIAFGQSDSLVVQIPSSGPADISMITAPDGFVPATDFNGYLHSKMGGSIIMTLIEHANSSAMDNAWEQDSTKIFVSRDALISTKGYTIFIYKEEAQAKIVGKEEYLKIFQYTVFIGRGEKVLWLSISHPSMVDDILWKGLLGSIMNADLTPGS